MIEIARALVSAEDAGQMCRVQSETRALCRRAGFDEAGVFQAVIAVSELAFRLLSETAGAVSLELSAFRHAGGLELRAETGPASGGEPVRVSLPFPFAAGASPPRAPTRVPRARTARRA